MSSSTAFSPAAEEPPPPTQASNTVAPYVLRSRAQCLAVSRVHLNVSNSPFEPFPVFNVPSNVDYNLYSSRESSNEGEKPHLQGSLVEKQNISNFYPKRGSKRRVGSKSERGGGHGFPTQTGVGIEKREFPHQKEGNLNLEGGAGLFLPHSHPPQCNDAHASEGVFNEELSNDAKFLPSEKYGGVALGEASFDVTPLFFGWLAGSKGKGSYGADGLQVLPLDEAASSSSSPNYSFLGYNHSLAPDVIPSGSNDMCVPEDLLVSPRNAEGSSVYASPPAGGEVEARNFWSSPRLASSEPLYESSVAVGSFSSSLSFYNPSGDLQHKPPQQLDELGGGDETLNLIPHAAGSVAAHSLASLSSSVLVRRSEHSGAQRADGSPEDVGGGGGYRSSRKDDASRSLPAMKERVSRSFIEKEAGAPELSTSSRFPRMWFFRKPGTTSTHSATSIGFKKASKKDAMLSSSLHSDKQVAFQGEFEHTHAEQGFSTPPISPSSHLRLSSHPSSTSSSCSFSMQNILSSEARGSRGVSTCSTTPSGRSEPPRNLSGLEQHAEHTASYSLAHTHAPLSPEHSIAVAASAGSPDLSTGNSGMLLPTPHLADFSVVDNSAHLPHTEGDGLGKSLVGNTGEMPSSLANRGSYTNLQASQFRKNYTHTSHLHDMPLSSVSGSQSIYLSSTTAPTASSLMSKSSDSVLRSYGYEGMSSAPFPGYTYELGSSAPILDAHGWSEGATTAHSVSIPAGSSSRAAFQGGDLAASLLYDSGDAEAARTLNAGISPPYHSKSQQHWSTRQQSACAATGGAIGNYFPEIDVNEEGGNTHGRNHSGGHYPVSGVHTGNSARLPASNEAYRSLFAHNHDSFSYIEGKEWFNFTRSSMAASSISTIEHRTHQSMIQVGDSSYMGFNYGPLSLSSNGGSMRTHTLNGVAGAPFLEGGKNAVFPAASILPEADTSGGNNVAVGSSLNTYPFDPALSYAFSDVTNTTRQLNFQHGKAPLSTLNSGPPKKMASFVAASSHRTASTNSFRDNTQQTYHEDLMSLNKPPQYSDIEDDWLNNIAVGGRSLMHILNVDGMYKISTKYSGHNSINHLAWNRGIPQVLAALTADCSLMLCGRNKKTGHWTNQGLLKSLHQKAGSCLEWVGCSKFVCCGFVDGVVKVFDPFGVIHNEAMKAAPLLEIKHTSNSSCRDLQSRFANQDQRWDANEILASFDDGIVKLYDFREKGGGKCFTMFISPSALPCARWACHDNTIFAAASREGVHICDLRKDDRPVYKIKTHTPCQAVRWRPGYPTQLATCASVLDESIMVWDLRHSTLPTYRLRGHTDVVRDFDWLNTHRIVSCGTDRKLLVHSIETAEQPLWNVKGASLSWHLGVETHSSDWPSSSLLTSTRKVLSQKLSVQFRKVIRPLMNRSSNTTTEATSKSSAEAPQKPSTPASASQPPHTSPSLGFQSSSTQKSEFLRYPMKQNDTSENTSPPPSSSMCLHSRDKGFLMDISLTSSIDGGGGGGGKHSLPTLSNMLRYIVSDKMKPELQVKLLRTFTVHRGFVVLEGISGALGLRDGFSADTLNLNKLLGFVKDWCWDGRQIREGGGGRSLMMYGKGGSLWDILRKIREGMGGEEGLEAKSRAIENEGVRKKKSLESLTLRRRYTDTDDLLKGLYSAENAYINAEAMAVSKESFDSLQSQFFPAPHIDVALKSSLSSTGLPCATLPSILATSLEELGVGGGVFLKLWDSFMSSRYYSGDEPSWSLPTIEMESYIFNSNEPLVGLQMLSQIDLVPQNLFDVLYSFNIRYIRPYIVDCVSRMIIRLLEGGVYGEASRRDFLKRLQLVLGARYTGVQKTPSKPKQRIVSTSASVLNDRNLQPSLDDLLFMLVYAGDEQLREVLGIPVYINKSSMMSEVSKGVPGAPNFPHTPLYLLEPKRVTFADTEDFRRPGEVVAATHTIDRSVYIDEDARWKNRHTRLPVPGKSSRDNIAKMKSSRTKNAAAPCSMVLIGAIPLTKAEVCYLYSYLNNLIGEAEKSKIWQVLAFLFKETTSLPQNLPFASQHQRQNRRENEVYRNGVTEVTRVPSNENSDFISALEGKQYLNSVPSFWNEDSAYYIGGTGLSEFSSYDQWKMKTRQALVVLCFTHYRLANDVHMSLALCMNLLPPSMLHVMRSTIIMLSRNYANLLKNCKLYVELIRFLNSSPFEEIQGIGREGLSEGCFVCTTELHSGTCGGLIKRNPYVPESSATLSGSTLCEKCGKQDHYCNVCGGAVMGLWVSCPVCLHGGHPAHINRWFNQLQHAYCPSGCGHACTFMASTAL